MVDDLEWSTQSGQHAVHIAHHDTLRTGTSVWVGDLDTDEFNEKFDSFRYAPRRRALGGLLGLRGPARKSGIRCVMLGHVGSSGSKHRHGAAEDPTRNRWDKGCPTTLVGTTESGFAAQLLVAAKATGSC